MRTLAYILVVLVYAGLVAFVLWLLAIRPRHPVKDKIASLLQLVAVYTFVLGFLSSAGVFNTFDHLQRNLTSRDPLQFLAANCVAFGIIFLAMSVAFNPSTSASIPRFLIGFPVLLAAMLLLCAYTIIHFLAVVPLAYFGYLATSVPIDAILNSSSDAEITSGEKVITSKKLVQQNETAIRNFAVALPALTISLVLKIAPLFRRTGELSPAASARRAVSESRGIWARWFLLYTPSGLAAWVVHVLFFLNFSTIFLAAIGVASMIWQTDPDAGWGILGLAILSLPALVFGAFARSLDRASRETREAEADAPHTDKGG